MNPLRTLSAIFENERNRWPLWTPVFIGVGIVIYFNLPSEPASFWLVATPLCIALLWHLRHIFALRLCLAIILMIALGFNAAQFETWLNIYPMLDREIGPAPVTGILMTTEAMPDGVRLTLSHPDIESLPPERTPLQVRIRVKDVDLQDIPPPGARIRLTAQVGATSEPVAPGAYDFRRQAFFQQVGGTGWAPTWSKTGIETLDADPPHSMMENFYLMFERARRALTLHVYSHGNDKGTAMTAALLNGEQSSISKSVMQDMRISGLSHLLSISGVHVSMMGLLVYFPMRALLALIPFIALRYPIKKWAAAFAIIVTALYTLLVGPQAPTLRSALSTSILMFAILTDRRTVSMRLLALTASLVMLVQPDGVMGPSFQMSFAAVLCMVAYYEKSLDSALAQGEALSIPAWIKFIRHHASAIIVTSLVATAATTPFTIYHFQTFSFYGVVTNMIAVPLTSFWVMPCILLAYITAPFNLDSIFITGAGWGVDVIIYVAHVVASWPLALIHLPAMPALSLILIAAGGLWLCLWRQAWRYVGFIAILVGAAYPLYTPQPDMFVADDGKEWAVRLNDGRMVVSNLDRDQFVVTQWQQRLGFPTMLDVDEMPKDNADVRCDSAGCVIRHGDVLIAAPTAENALVEDCDRAAVVITPAAVRDCAATTIIDDNQLWHHGAEALYFAGDRVDVRSVRERRGERPWSAGWGYKYYNKHSNDEAS